MGNELIAGSVPKATRSVLDKGPNSLALSAGAGVALCARRADGARQLQIRNPCRRPFVHTHQTSQAAERPLPPQPRIVREGFETRLNRVVFGCVVSNI